MSNSRFPLAEVFGIPTVNESSTEEEIQLVKESFRSETCPFTGEHCEKLEKSGNAACSTYWGSSNEPIITCPKRFEERGKIFRDATEFIFGGRRSMSEVLRAEETEVGITEENENRCDYIIFDRNSKTLGLLEIQSVYNMSSTNVPFNLYSNSLEEDSLNSLQDREMNDPDPDILSSIKRIVFQMMAKGRVFKKWGMRQVYVTQKSFYDHLGLEVEGVGKPNYYQSEDDYSVTASSDEYTPLQTSDISSVDRTEVAWFLYDIEKRGGRYSLVNKKEIYTTYDKLIDGIRTTFEDQYSSDEFYEKVVDSFERRDLGEKYYNQWFTSQGDLFPNPNKG